MPSISTYDRTTDVAHKFVPTVDIASDPWGNLAVAWGECGNPGDAAADCSPLSVDLRLRWLRSDMTLAGPSETAHSQMVGPAPPLSLAMAPSGIAGVTFIREQDVVVRLSTLMCP